MDRKNCLRVISGCILTVILLFCVLECLSNILERKDSRIIFQEFYEQSENFDVLFFGTSHMDSAVSPMDMWEQNGIVGYNMATSGCRIATSYWMLKNSLQYTSPKLVVVDCAYLEDAKTSQNINYMHRVFDAMPFSKVKVEALLDLYGTSEEILRFLFPFSLYHNRWDELTRDDFFFDPQYGKMGVDPDCDVVPAEILNPMADTVVGVDNISTQYLVKIIKLCEEEKIDLLFTYIPFFASSVSKNDAVYIRELAKEYGVNYLDPTELLRQLNPKVDFRDNDYDNSHVNFSGTHKLSYYLGNYIMENYPIQDRRQDPKYKKWHDYYDLYLEYKKSLWMQTTILDDYLVGISDKNYIVMVKIVDEGVFADEMVTNLLQNLGFSPDAFAAGGNRLESNGTTEENENYMFEFDSDGTPVCRRDGDICYVWSNSAKNADIFVMVMDKKDMRILDGAAFSMETKEKIQ